MVFLDADGILQLRIVDWELLDLGDGCWDVAGIFQAYLVYLIKNTALDEFKEDDVLDILIENAIIILPSIKAFWRNYCVTLEMP